MPHDRMLECRTPRTEHPFGLYSVYNRLMPATSDVWPLRIVYGVTGEGMGHATRSRVIIEHLLNRGHHVRVVVSGRAHAFLTDRLKQHPGVSIHEISGLTLTYVDNRVDRTQSLLRNLKHAPKGVRANLKVYRRVAEGNFAPHAVFSDFESWAALYATNHFLPVISIDNMQVINRCEHDSSLLGGASFDRRLAKLAVMAKIPGAFHYLITSFFFPTVSKKRTTLVPPILRPEILSAKREPGNHILVYQTSDTNHELVERLKQLPYEFRFYGMRRHENLGNVLLKNFSEQDFVDDLRTARAVISGGGFTLMSEAVSLGVPMLSIPVERQFEQVLNARYLEKLGYGKLTETLDSATISAFLENLPSYVKNLESYPRQDNSMMLACVDELVERIAHGKKRPTRLRSPNMGHWAGDD